jgi:hypothetical protein
MFARSPPVLALPRLSLTCTRTCLPTLSVSLRPAEPRRRSRLRFPRPCWQRTAQTATSVPPTHSSPLGPPLTTTATTARARSGSVQQSRGAVLACVSRGRAGSDGSGSGSRRSRGSLSGTTAQTATSVPPTHSSPLGPPLTTTATTARARSVLVFPRFPFLFVQQSRGAVLACVSRGRAGSDGSGNEYT